MHRNRFKYQKIAPAAPFSPCVEYHKRENRIVYESKKISPSVARRRRKFCILKVIKLMFYLTKWAPQVIFLGVRTLKLGFTLENERPRQDFLVPQPISPDLRIWSPENEGGTTTRGGQLA